MALLDVVFRLFEIVVDIFQTRGFREILDRKYRSENSLQPFVLTAALRLNDLQKLVVRGLLNLDKIRHLRHFDHLAEVLAKPLASSK